MSRLAPGEDDPHHIEMKLVLALLRQLRRSGVLNEGMMDRVRSDIESDIAYHEGNSSQGDYVDMMLMLEAFDEQAMGAGLSEFRAAQKRKALRERNTRPRPIDGGNSSG